MKKYSEQRIFIEGCLYQRHSAHPDRIREQKPRGGQVEMGLARPMLGGKEFTAPWGRKLWGTPVCHLPVDLMKTPGQARFQGVSVLETAEKEVDGGLIH